MTATPSCRSCGAAPLAPVLSLGRTPLANSLRDAAQLGAPEPTFPLDLAVCPRCALVQITTEVPPDDLFRENAERRVQLGLLIGEVIRKEEVKATPERVRAEIQELASTYEDPDEVVSWYYSNKEQLAAVEAVVLEDQVIDLILGRATITDVNCSYEEALRPDPQPQREGA